MRANPFEILVLIILGVVIANMVVLPLAVHPTVGRTHHGIVVEEICNGTGGDSYVVLNYSGIPRSYSICLEFLTKHGAGVTVTDDAWFNRMASYRFD